MASDFDRDNSIDALLKGARRNPAPASNVEAGPACLDAETLAAWADGGLDADRVRAIEAHVADCARCQALSAAFFSSDDTAATGTPTVVPFRRKPVMYWLPIAAGTIAATLVIWLGVRDKNAAIPQPQAVTADSRAAETPAPAVEESRLQANQAQQGTSALAAPQGKAAAPADAKRPERKEAAPVQLGADRSKQEAATANQFRQVAAEPVASPTAKAAAPPPPAVMPPPPQPVSAPPITAQAAPPPPPPVAAAAAPPARQSSVVMRETVEPRIVAEFSSVLAQSSTVNGLPGNAGGVVGGVAGGGGGGRGGRGGGGGGGRGAAITLDAVNVASPPFYWRILSTDVIERSVDKLKWEAIAIDPPVQGLAGGAAPSATVCWIIGRAGLVLLTTDGKEFTRVSQPAPAGLISITAQDALRATVTTVGGQAFSTTDGGKSWK